MASDRKYRLIGQNDSGVSTTNVQDGSYTFVLADANNIVLKSSGGAGETYTIPANSSVAYDIGTLIAVTNDGGGDLTIAITTDTLEGTDGATGSRTLSDNHSATLEKLTATKWRYTSTDGASISKNVGIFTDSSSQSITTSAATLVFDTETTDVDTNYALSSGEITATAAGWYWVSVNLIIDNDDTLGATRCQFTAQLQQDGAVPTWVDVNNVQARSEIRESSSLVGDGVNFSGLVSLLAGEAIRVRIVQDANTTNSTVAGECTLNIFRVSE